MVGTVGGGVAFASLARGLQVKARRAPPPRSAQDSPCGPGHDFSGWRVPSPSWRPALTGVTNSARCRIVVHSGTSARRWIPPGSHPALAGAITCQLADGSCSLVSDTGGSAMTSRGVRSAGIVRAAVIRHLVTARFRRAPPPLSRHPVQAMAVTTAMIAIRAMSMYSRYASSRPDCRRLATATTARNAPSAGRYR